MAASSAWAGGGSNQSNVARIAAPGHDVEHDGREIDACDLRLSMRPQPIARVPQPHRDARRRPSRASRALIGRVGRDALLLEAVHQPIRVVPRDLVQPGVDDDAHVRHGQRGLGDVGGENHARLGRRGDGGVLLVRAESPVERQHARAAVEHRRQAVGGAPNLGRARQEAQRRARAKRIPHGVLERDAGPVDHLDRMRAAGHVDDRTVTQKCGDAGRVDRGGHHHDAEIAAREPCLPRERDAEIRVQAALVELVDDDGSDVAEQRILLQPRGQDAFGDDGQAGVGGGAAIEPDVPSHLAAERPALLGGDAPRDRARGHASRLQQQDRAVAHERGRHARRLSRARRRGERPARGALARGA